MSVCLSLFLSFSLYFFYPTIEKVFKGCLLKISGFPLQSSPVNTSKKKKKTKPREFSYPWSRQEARNSREQPPKSSPLSPSCQQMFVRLFVDENLDRMVPISKQPKEKIQAIIDSCRRQFPEYQERARKRIRTYLKSCRRMKRSGFEMVSFDWKHSPRFHPNPTCKPWRYLFFHPSVFFYFFSMMSGHRGSVCSSVPLPLLLLIFLKYIYSLFIQPVTPCEPSAHRPTWYHVIENEGGMSQIPWEPASHSCLFAFCCHWSGEDDEEAWWL